MNTDFLKNLREALDSGKESDAIKDAFSTITNKADDLAADPENLKEIKEKMEKKNEEDAKEVVKKYTPEEIAKLNRQAQEQMDLMYENEKKAFITSGVIAMNCEVETIEKEIANRVLLIEKYKEASKTLQGDGTYEDKKQLINKSIAEFNKRGKAGKVD